jgi:hypothetical protein
MENRALSIISFIISFTGGLLTLVDIQDDWRAMREAALREQSEVKAEEPAPETEEAKQTATGELQVVLKPSRNHSSHTARFTGLALCTGSTGIGRLLELLLDRRV